MHLLFLKFILDKSGISNHNTVDGLISRLKHILVCHCSVAQKFFTLNQIFGILVVYFSKPLGQLSSVLANFRHCKK